MELTLVDLAREVATRIQRDGVRQGNGQVSSFPDGRTLRYYSTIGLLDRPLAMRGRQAIYGERHVLQAVAVKRMQAGGLSLGEIQTRLAGLPTPELAQVAEAGVAAPVPAGGPRGRWWAAPVTDSAAASGPLIPPSAGTSPAGSGVDARWTVNMTARRASAHDDAGNLASAAPLPPFARANQAASDTEEVEPATTLTAVPLGAGATLILPADGPLNGADLDAIRRAAAPLADYLAAAGLTRPRPDPKDRR